MNREKNSCALFSFGFLSILLVAYPYGSSEPLLGSGGLRSRYFYGCDIVAAEFIIFCCLLTTIVHIVPHARDHWVEPTTAAAVLSTIGGVSMLGRILMGTANDRRSIGYNYLHLQKLHGIYITSSALSI